MPTILDKVNTLFVKLFRGIYHNLGAITWINAHLFILTVLVTFCLFV